MCLSVFFSFGVCNLKKRKKRFLIPEIEARATPPKPVPICLPDSSDSLSDRLEEKNGRTKKDIQDDYAMVTGWGLVTEGKVGKEIKEHQNERM